MAMLVQCDHAGCTVQPFNPESGNVMWFSASVNGSTGSGAYSFCSINHLVEFMRNLSV